MKVQSEELVLLFYPDRELPFNPVYFYLGWPGGNEEIVGTDRVRNKYGTLRKSRIPVSLPVCLYKKEGK